MEGLDILFNVPRFRRRKAHDNLEELFTLGFGFGNGQRAKAFQISPNAILLLDGKAHPDERLQKVNGIHAGDEALPLFLPKYTADADAVRGPIFGSNGLEVGVDRAPILHARELNQTPLAFLLCHAPILQRRH